MPRIRIAHSLTSSEAYAAYDRLIHSYGYKPTPRFSFRNREADNALTFGVENETEYKPAEYSIEALASAAISVTDLEPERIYLKRDGSVHTGFEIVSHPASLASHMYDAHWTGILNKCSRHGMRSHDAKTWGGSCGLHVHVGRKQLGRNDEERAATIRKVKILVYKHWDAMVKFSRRSEAQLSDWACREISARNLEYIAESNDPAQAAADYISITNSHNGRYKAVNCENSATIEFRLFNGTLKRDTLIATLQLCSNICKYAMAHDFRECLDSDFLSVALFERFNELDTYLRARGLANDSDTPNRPQNTNRIPRHNGADGVEG